MIRGLPAVRIQAAVKRGFQTQTPDAEIALARMLADMAQSESYT